MDIKSEIQSLTPELTIKHNEALSEGYKDEICSKCGAVLLAHHHFVKCDLAKCGDCPMVPKDSKSLLDQLLG